MGGVHSTRAEWEILIARDYVAHQGTDGWVIYSSWILKKMSHRTNLTGVKRQGKMMGFVNMIMSLPLPWKQTISMSADNEHLYLRISIGNLFSTQPPVQWVPGLSRGQSGRGVVLTTHPLLAPRSGKSRAIPLPPLWAFEPVTGYLLIYLAIQFRMLDFGKTVSYKMYARVTILSRLPHFV
jgi:hypothetical protein